MRNFHIGFLLLVLFVAACVPKHNVVMNAGGIAIGAPLTTVDDGPFRLLYAGPKGPVTKSADITLAFSRSLPHMDAPATVVRDNDNQPVEGTWQWFGESAAIFHPAKDFARATTFRVEPRALTAVDGSKLEPAPPFTFTTERPKMTGASYSYDEKTNQHHVDIAFDQAVSPAAVVAAIRIEDGAGKALPFKMLDESAARGLTMQVDPAIARMEDLVVVATTALRGVEGPLGPEAEARLKLDGVGPFKVKLTCDGDDKVRKCAWNASVGLELTREVTTGDLVRRLEIAPPAKADPDQLKEIRTDTGTWPTNSFNLGAFLGAQPGKKYKVTLKAGLTSNDKQRLSNDQVFEFELGDSPPDLRWRDVTAPFMAVESGRKLLPLVLESTNVPSFDLVSAPFDEKDLGRFMFVPKETAYDALIRAQPNSAIAKVTPKAPKNESTMNSITLAEGRAAGATGAWAVGTHAPGFEDDLHILSITDLGITTKWSPHGALVWVTKLSTAEPVSGATVSLRRIAGGSTSEAFATTTDREGIALIPGDIAATFLHEDEEPNPPAPVLVVKQGTDWTFQRLPELDHGLMFAIGDVFVDRGLYRPGESMMAKGYFRMPGPKGLTNLAGKTVYLEALDNAQHVFSAQTTTLDAFGAFSAEIPIPKSARMGRAMFRARLGTKPPTAKLRSWEYWQAHDSFTIDAFRTPEFKVEAKVERASIVRGESVALTGTGMYLLGAPMTDVAADVTVSRHRTSFTPPGLDGFSTTDDAFAEREKELTNSKLTGKLDPKGHAFFTYPTESTKTAAMPESYSFEVDISDVSKVFSMGDSTSVLVHPSDVYLGIKADLGAPPLVPGKSVRAELVAAGIDGARRALGANVELYQANEKGDPVTTHRTCAVTADSTKTASCALSVTAEGRHWLRATGVDASGRAIATSTAFIVQPKNTKPPPPPPPPLTKPVEPAPTFEEECRLPSRKNDWRDELMIATHGDRPYRVGENAVLCLRTKEKSPNQRALFTLEREGVLRREPVFDFATSESHLLNVPITEELFPEVNIALSEVRGRHSPFPASGHPDSGWPEESSSNQRLSVTVPAKKLSVAIETDKEARPGAEIELRLNVKDGDNRAVNGAQVTLWAIDEGIHLLMPKPVPTPDQLFGTPRGEDVVESDTRKNIFYEHGSGHRTKAPSVRMGATSVSDSKLVGRSVFRPTAFFLPSIVTSANGTATVRAQLPDNLTTWKVFAVTATAGDQFGSGETSFTTNKPLMIRPQLPRFLRTGDRFAGTLMIDSLAKSPIDVALSVRATGVLAATLPAANIHIPAEGHVPVQIPIEAKAVGTGKLVFSVKGPSQQDEVTVDEEVKSIAAMELVAVAADIPSSKSPITVNEPLGDLSKVRPDVGGFDYRLSTTPLVGLATSLNDLVEYPYGCTEQLTSRLVPLIRLRGMANDYGVALPPNIDAAVRSALSSLLTHQRSDGGFGFWRESNKSEAWLTVLALGALQVATEHGYSVPADAVASAQKWLEQPSTLDPAANAMREDLLASLGKPREAELRALAGNPKLPRFARALTAHGRSTAIWRRACWTACSRRRRSAARRSRSSTSPSSSRGAISRRRRARPRSFSARCSPSIRRTRS